MRNTELRSVAALALAACLLIACAAPRARAGFVFATEERGMIEENVPSTIESAAPDGSVPDGSAPGASAPDWSHPIPREILEDPDGLLILVNASHPLPRAYPPEEILDTLTDATVKKTKNLQMKCRPVAHDALIRMFDAMTAEGLRPRLHSAYRSYQTQATQYELRIGRIGHDDGRVQKEGASEHQTGLAFDIVNPDWTSRRFTDAFAETGEGRWMAENAHRFGFIIRYPLGAKEITGIHYEPWHLRYVGDAAAAYIEAHGLTLEAFSQERDAYLEGTRTAYSF